MIQHTTLVIETAEAVSPEHLARRVAEACGAYGALRPGERVGAQCVTPTPWFEISDLPVDIGDLFADRT